jgi:uncharacterized protein YneF (UPF0154 family)
MKFSKEALFLFFILSVPLLIFTLLGWFLVDRHIRKQLRKKAKERAVDLLKSQKGGNMGVRFLV